MYKMFLQIKISKDKNIRIKRIIIYNQPDIGIQNQIEKVIQIKTE